MPDSKNATQNIVDETTNHAGKNGVLITLVVEGRWDWESRTADASYDFIVSDKDFDLLKAIHDAVNDYLSTPEGMEYFNDNRDQFIHGDRDDTPRGDGSDHVYIDMGNAISILNSEKFPPELFDKYGFLPDNSKDRIYSRSGDMLFTENETRKIGKKAAKVAKNDLTNACMKIAEDRGINANKIEALINQPGMKYDQICEIKEGLEEGLTQEQIELYAKPEYNYYQMEQIKEGFKLGLSMEQVAVYANPEFDYRQMEEIKQGFEHGLSIEQVQEYANPEHDSLEMRTLRETIEKENLNGNTLDDLINKAQRKCEAEKASRTSARTKGLENVDLGDDGAI